MRRLGAPLAGVAAAGVFVAIAGGLEAGALGGLAGALLLGGVAWAVVGWVQRRRPTRRDGWNPGAAVPFHPAAGHEAASPQGVATALGRVESRELAASASFGVGVGFSLLVLLLFGRVWAADYEGDLLRFMEMYPIFTHPLAGLVVLAAHRARTRSTREGTEELFEACPTSQATRTVGHLLTAWLPAAFAVAFLIVLTVLVLHSPTLFYGDVGARQVADLLGAAALAVGAAALGVALARWTPWSIVPVAAVIAIGFGSIRLATAGNRTTEPIRQLSTWLNEPGMQVRFTAPHWVAHHLWIVALVAVVAVLAVLRDKPGPRLVAVGAAAAVIAGVSGIAATRPIDTTDATRIASLIDEPEAHQRCVDAAGLPVCTYPSDGPLADHIASVVTPVAAAAPRDALTGWVVRHGSDLQRTELDPEVRRLLHDPDDHVVPMKMVSHHGGDQGARFWVALTAAGVLDDIIQGAVLSLDHQARGVIVLWLATRGVDADEAAEMTSFNADALESSPSYARPWPEVCAAGPTPVTWALTDLDAARLLMAQPEAAVAELLRSDWDRLTDPATSTDELLVMAGLPSVPHRAGVTRSGDVC